MRFLSILLAASAAVTAQSPLTTTFAANNGQAGNMFDLRPINGDIIVTDFDLNLDPGVWDVEIYTVTGGGSHVGNEQNPAAWTLEATITGVTGAGLNLPSPLGASLSINCPNNVNTGIYVTVNSGVGINYLTGTGFVVGDVYASNSDLEFLAGTGNVYPFGVTFGPPAASRVFSGNIYYQLAGGGPFSSRTYYGAGCGGGDRTSFHETMPAAAIDLSGLKIDALNTGQGLLVQAIPGSGITVGAGAQALTVGDDAEVDTASVGGTLGLWVGSNGWVATGPGNDTGFNPSSVAMLANPNTGIYCWNDLHTTFGGGGGEIYYEETAGVATITYDGVHGWNTGQGNTIQIIYDSNLGNWSMEFTTLDPTAPAPWVVGYSVGGPSIPNAVDISDAAANPILTGLADTVNLQISSNVPSIGGTWDINATGVDAISPLAIFILGSRATVPVPLQFIGFNSPGCDVWLASGDEFISVPAAGGTASLPLPMPANPVLAGGMISCQALSLTLNNPGGVVSSNGIEVQIY